MSVSSPDSGSVTTKKSYCRFCHAYCAIEVDVDDRSGRVLAVRGDTSDPIYGGYTCIKGRQLPKLDVFIDLMKPLGLVDVSRTGVVAIARGPKGL